jgi:transposase InsO family protein
MRSSLIAATAGVSVATVRRWNARPHARISIPRRAPEPPAGATAHVEQLVRDLRGLVGAEALSHAVPGVSRRQAARIKHATLTAMECERQASVARLTVTEPGVMRGFDAMHVPTTEGGRYVLCAGDASVPYRTCLDVVERYDEGAVLDAITHDLEAHGAPLVWRMDRASVHRTPGVRELLAANNVLILHGPPHYPGFYGQLERQNREHRAWLQQRGPLDPDALEEECAAMLAALNDRWPRRTLRWQTAGQAWRARMEVRDDRRALKDEVHERTARIERDMPKPDSDLASRLAIEQVLTKRGYLQRELGGWC